MPVTSRTRSQIRKDYMNDAFRALQAIDNLERTLYYGPTEFCVDNRLQINSLKPYFQRAKNEIYTIYQRISEMK